MFFRRSSFHHLLAMQIGKQVRLFLGGLLLLAGASGYAQTTIHARRADQFVDSLGVNVHMEYANTPYQNYGLINRRLRELGMRHFRDEINNTDPAFVGELQAIGRLGYSLCGLIEGGNDYPAAGATLQASAVVPMIQNLLPTIEAVEGPNEPDDGWPNNDNFIYGKEEVPYPQGAINESEDLWKIVQGSSAISELPVVGLSEGNAPDFTVLAGITPPPIDYATFGNMHAYQNGGVGDDGLPDWYMPYSQDLTGSKPLWTTEMGYHNNTRYLSDGEQQGVSERASAIYLPIAFLTGFHRGVLQTFSYELIDEFYDPNLTSGSGEGHYGLLNFDGTAKPAFTAMKNLITLLRQRENRERENREAVKDFEPGSLTITFSRAPERMHYTLLQTSSGEYYLALWNDVWVYELARETESGKIVPGKDLYPQSVPITVTFAAPKTLTVFAPNDPSGVNPTDAYTISKTSRSINLLLPPKVLLIKIVDAAGGLR